MPSTKPVDNYMKAKAQGLNKKELQGKCRKMHTCKDLRSYIYELIA